MADSDSPCADFDRAVGLFAGAEAIDPVATMAAVSSARRFVQMDFVFGDGLLDDRIRLALDLAAVYVQFAFRAEESDAVAAAVDDFRAVVVHELDAASGRWILGWHDFHGSRLVHPQTPLSDVEMVSSPVGHSSTAVLTEVPPGRKVAVHAARTQYRTVFAQWSGPEPSLPVQSGFRFLAGQIAGTGGPPTPTSMRWILPICPLRTSSQA